MKFLVVLALAAIVYSANGAALQKRDLKSDLLARAATLETQATAEIKKLTDAGRSREATHLQTEEKRLQQLANELKDATAEVPLRRLEAEIRAIEMRIAEELRRLGGRVTTVASATTAAAATTAASFVKRDLKSDLLDRAASLETRATAAIKKLQDSGKSAEATHLQTEEKRLQQLATELKSATADAALRRLETEIRFIEMRMTEELRRIERPGNPTTTAASFVKRAEKDPLVAKAAALEKKANDEIKKLTAAGKKADAATLEKEEKALQKLAEELKAATDAAEIKRLDTEVTAAEKRLTEELKRLAGKNPTGTTAAPLVKRAEKDPLVAKAAALEKKANDEIKKLTAAGKKADAATLEKEEKALQKLAEELKAATDAAEIKRLDTEVSAAEKRLAEELKRLAGKNPTGTTTASF